MGQILHGCAKTTETIRRAIQNSKESIAKLSRYSSFHRSPDMIRLRIDGDKEVGCRQHIVMI